MPLNKRILHDESTAVALPPREKETLLPSIASHRGASDYVSTSGNAFPVISKFSFEAGFR
jgi:hypothetical protein